MTPVELITAIIVLITYAGIAIGRIPGFGMNRATITLVGAGALLLLGILTEKQTFEALDLATLMLLFAMMIINTNLRMAGFFRLAANRILRVAKSPRMLLGLVVVISGVLSALFLNDPVCLLITPLVVDVTKRLNRNPIPYLVGLATAANIGSSATITGNPQNLIIGQASGIPYLTFLLRLGPIAVVGLVICWGVIMLVYPQEFKGDLPEITLPDPQIYPALLRRNVVIVAGLLVAFLAGLPIASSAFVAACFLLISRLRPHKHFAIDWELLAFFSGLFIVTHAIEVTGLSEHLFAAVGPIIQGGVASLSLATAALSNVVSNVPAVLLFRPEIPHLANPEQGWLILAMSSTLAGNLTLLGSVANLIVAEVAARRGVQLSFEAYLRAGVPITILTLGFGIVWLSLWH
jgi:Na+/H+ antiporter NhaD/arsenite permease-like protein